MATLGEQLTTIKTFFTEQGEDIDGLVLSVNGVVGDVAVLLKKIEELQGSPGAITPADQALLDEIQTLAGQTKTKLGAVKTDLAALDAQNPPVIPPPPPNP